MSHALDRDSESVQLFRAALRFWRKMHLEGGCGPHDERRDDDQWSECAALQDALGSPEPPAARDRASLDWRNEIDDVRTQLNERHKFDASTTAQYDEMRAHVHELLRVRGIDASSSEFERVWIVAGGVIGELLADLANIDLLSSKDAHERAAAIATAVWLTGISPHSAEQLPT